MSFADSLRICLKTKIFNWQDRAIRSEYWWFCLFLVICHFLLPFLALIPMIGVIAYTISVLYLWWAHLMVSIRRLHDKDKSGLLLLVPFALMVAAIIIAFMGDAGSDYSDDMLLSVAGTLTIGAFGFSIYLFILFVTEGTVGYNRFGPDPLAWYRQNAFQNQGFNPNLNQGFDPRYNPNYQPNGQQNYTPNYDPNMPPQGYNPNIPPQGYNPTNSALNPDPRYGQQAPQPRAPQQPWNNDSHGDAHSNNHGDNHGDAQFK